ncbi:hypothetical protein ACHAXT_000497 [Thalassiosira profunda]
MMGAMDLQQTSRRRRSSLYLQPSSEFGAISASSAPPRLNPELIDAALVRLPWEVEEEDDTSHALDEDLDLISGERWFNTRQILTRLWVLPRDMSNGSWEAYADAANRGEDAMLTNVPQLLRLSPDEVEASAKTVLKELQLPPALLRREPALLTVPPERLVGGFDAIVQLETEKEDSSDVVLAARKVCRDEQGLLLKAATA